MGRSFRYVGSGHFPPDSRPLLFPLDNFCLLDSRPEALRTGVEHGDVAFGDFCTGVEHGGMALDDLCTGKEPGDTALGDDSCSWLSMICTV